MDSKETGAQAMYTTADHLIHRSTSPASGSGLALYNQALTGWPKRIGAALLGRDGALRHWPTNTNVRLIQTWSIGLATDRLPDQQKTLLAADEFFAFRHR
jgi:hypothetical protein